MKNIFSILFRCIKWLLSGAAITALVVLACWILLPDETLNPDAQRIIEAKPTVPPAQNAYYALLALKASPELDAFEVGKQIVAAQVAIALQPNGYEAEFSPDVYLGVKPLVAPQIRLNTQLFCRPVSETPNCLAAFREHRDLIDAELRDLDIYVKRYRSARNYPHFEDVMMPTANMPFVPWPAINQMSELVDAKIALDMAEPTKQEAALSELLAEILFWQRIGDETNMLDTRLASAKLVQKNYRLASELLAAYPQIAVEHKDLLAKITHPLSSKATDLRLMLEGELQLFAVAMQRINKKHQSIKKDGEANVFGHVHRLSRAVARSPFRLNASNNLYYAHMIAVGDFYSRTGVELGANAAAFESSINHYNGLDPRTWLYNPVGKVLAGIAVPQYSSYAYRLHDLAGYSRLVELQRQIALSHTAPEKIAEFIAAADANLADPYTGKPMAYDPVTKTISFTPQGKIDSGAGAVRINTVVQMINAKP
jgi:hypothetical protein